MEREITVLNSRSSSLDFFDERKPKHQFSPKTAKKKFSKIGLANKGFKDKNFIIRKEAFPEFFRLLNSELGNGVKELCDEIFLVKEVLVGLIGKINEKTKDEEEKQNKIKRLEFVCDKNKKKIKKLKALTKEHNDLIGDLEKKIVIVAGSLSERKKTEKMRWDHVSESTSNTKPGLKQFKLVNLAFGTNSKSIKQNLSIKNSLLQSSPSPKPNYHPNNNFD